LFGVEITVTKILKVQYEHILIRLPFHFDQAFIEHKSHKLGDSNFTRIHRQVLSAPEPDQGPALFVISMDEYELK
jgi:hypothetical protein